MTVWSLDSTNSTCPGGRVYIRTYVQQHWWECVYLVFTYSTERRGIFIQQREVCMQHNSRSGTAAAWNLGPQGRIDKAAQHWRAGRLLHPPSVRVQALFCGVSHQGGNMRRLSYILYVRYVPARASTDNSTHVIPTAVTSTVIWDDRVRELAVRSTGVRSTGVRSTGVRSTAKRFVPCQGKGNG